MNIPEKLSIDDPEFKSYWFDKNLTVYLNGMEVKNVIFYDMKAGRLERYKSDDKGHLIVSDDRVATETLHGNISVNKGA